MKSITQYRVAGNGWSTQWYDSLALASNRTDMLAKEDAQLVSRVIVVGEPVPKMGQPMAKLVNASKWEIARMQMEAHKQGKSFASQQVGPAIYRVMSI